jgi:2-polyprenyl-6-methoxyphenol hydroxylase-like FAD-dependent oxidoreductase
MAIEDGIVLAEELGTQPTLEQALQNFMTRRFERCRLVVESSVRLGQIEMSRGSPAEHTRVMSEALGALREAI